MKRILTKIEAQRRERYFKAGQGRGKIDIMLGESSVSATKRGRPAESSYTAFFDFKLAHKQNGGKGARVIAAIKLLLFGIFFVNYGQCCAADLSVDYSNDRKVFIDGIVYESESITSERLVGNINGKHSEWTYGLSRYVYRGIKDEAILIDLMEWQDSSKIDEVQKQELRLPMTDFQAILKVYRYPFELSLSIKPSQDGKQITIHKLSERRVVPESKEDTILENQGNV